MNFDFLTLKQKVAELATRVTYNVAGVADYDDVFLGQVGTWLQLSEALLREINDYWTELQDIHNFSSVVSPVTESYDMPEDFDKALRVYDLTNKKKITHTTEEVYSDSNIANIADSTTGTPDKYRIYGVSAGRKQMKLGLIPDAVISYRVLYKKIPAGMSADDSKAFVIADRYLIFDAYGYSLKQDKEDTKANFAWQKAQEALTALLNNQGLGPDYQHKIINQWIQSHRA